MLGSFTNILSKENVLKFDIHDIDLSIVNSLRRIILSEIPTIAMAFDPTTDNNPDITISVNNSALHNEYLAHRLSLIPLCFPEDVVDSDFDGDVAKNYEFKLKVKNTSSDNINVTTHDIKIYDAKGKLYPDEFHEKIFPKNKITKDYLLITKLRPNIYNPEQGDEIDIAFRGSKNISKAHARWSSVSCCAFHNIVDEDAAEAALKIKLDEYKEFKGGITKKEEVSFVNRFNTLDKYRFFNKNKYDEANAFHFDIESECGLSPKYIFNKAINVLRNKIEKFIDDVRNGIVVINKIHETQMLYDVIIANEDYTLVNVLQCMLYNLEIRGNPTTSLEYIGYNQPHPLDNKMVLKVKLKNDLDLPEFLTEGCERINEMLMAIEINWNKVCK